MNGNLVVSAVVKSEEWKTSLFDIVVKWKSDCLLAVDSATDGSWKTIFNACEPWELAHMANITLCTNLPYEFPKRINDGVVETEAEVIATYALLMAEIALGYDDVDKQALYEIHEQLLGLGSVYIRNGMLQPWPDLTWDQLLRWRTQGVERKNHSRIYRFPKGLPLLKVERDRGLIPCFRVFLDRALPHAWRRNHSKGNYLDH